jgi:hypothetical protein
VDGVVDQIVGAPVGVDRRDAVAAVGVDHAVEDQSVGVAAGDGDAAVALAGAVAEDPQALEVDRLVLVVAAQEADRLAPGPGDGEPAEGDELRLLEADGEAVGALGDRALEDDAARGRGRVGLDHDTIGLARARRVVLAGDGDLLVIGARLELKHLARERRVHGGLERGVAGRVPAARRVGRVDVARARLGPRRRGRQEPGRDRDEQQASHVHRFVPPAFAVLPGTL